MVEIMLEISKQLLGKLRKGEADSKDISNAIKLLQNNGINVAVNKGSPMDILREDLPFHSGLTVVK